MQGRLSQRDASYRGHRASHGRTAQLADPCSLPHPEEGEEGEASPGQASHSSPQIVCPALEEEERNVD